MSLITIVSSRARSRLFRSCRSGDLRRPSRRTGAPWLLVLALASALTPSIPRAAEPTDSANFADLDLEQLMQMPIASVYGASKHEQQLTQAPSSITIVTAEEIERFGHRTLLDVLRSVRGLYVTDDRNYSYLGIRGFHRPNDYTTRVLVLIDGHRVNDNVYDSGTIGREGMIDVELIDRVEVIRGPSSSIYGSSAFLGVINVVTKRGSRIGGLEIGADAASNDTYRARMTHGGKSEAGLEWLVSASHYSSNGETRLYYPEFDPALSDDPRAADGGVARNLDAEEAKGVFASLRYRDWSVSAFVSDRQKDVPTASFLTIFNDGEEWTDDERGYLDLKYERSLGELLHVQARGFYDIFHYGGAYPYDYAEPGDPPDRVVSMDRTVGEWLGAELQLTAQLTPRTRLITGGEYRESLREDQAMWDDLDPPVYYLDDRRTSSILGLFAQLDTKLLENLTLSAGLRHDDYSTRFDDVTTPRLALIYNPNPRSAIKVLYGEAFRAPNPYESYYSLVQWERPPLDAETVRTYELAYEHYLGSQYRVGASAYSYRVEDLIAQATTDEGDPYFDNLDSARAHGIELEIERRLGNSSFVRASYALQRSDDGTGKELSNSPRQLGKLNLAVPLREHLLAGVELQYHGSVLTLQDTRAADFWITNLTLIREQIRAGMNLSLAIHNAFDARHGYPGAEDHLQNVIEQNGRTFQAKVTYAF